MDVRPHLPKRDNRNFQFSALNLIYVSVAFTPSGRVHRWVRFPLHPRRIFVFCPHSRKVETRSRGCHRTDYSMFYLCFVAYEATASLSSQKTSRAHKEHTIDEDFVEQGQRIFVF